MLRSSFEASDVFALFCGGASQSILQARVALLLLLPSGILFGGEN